MAKKLNEEQQKNNEEIKKEIDSKMEQYIEKKEISSAINQELEIFSQGKGLTVNPSLSKIKKEIAAAQSFCEDYKNILRR